MSPFGRNEPPLPAAERKRVLEAILFATDGPVTLDMLAECLPAEDAAELQADIEALGEEYEASGASFELVRIAGGFQICTRERWATWVARFQRGSRRVRLSRPAVETLAIIAYRQPITRSEMEDIRGVDSGAVLHTLLERNLITIKGRSKGVGRPLLYATTGDFLEYFGLDRLEDLPRLDEIESILKEREEPIEIEMDRLPAGVVQEGGELVPAGDAPADLAAAEDPFAGDTLRANGDEIEIDGILGQAGFDPGPEPDPDEDQADPGAGAH
jgi:segregation and condensation protein B